MEREREQEADLNVLQKGTKGTGFGCIGYTRARVGYNVEKNGPFCPLVFRWIFIIGAPPFNSRKAFLTSAITFDAINQSSAKKILHDLN